MFGTTAVLLVTDAGALGQARALADAELAAVDRAASRFRPDSELAALNGPAARRGRGQRRCSPTSSRPRCGPRG